MATGKARVPGMAEKDICIMHVVNNSSGKLTAFTYTSWCNFLTYAAKWKKLNCNEAKIAVDSATRLGLRLESESIIVNMDDPEAFLPIPAHCKFHRDCYNRFCNKSKLEREQKRQLERVKSTVEGRK